MKIIYITALLVTLLTFAFAHETCVLGEGEGAYQVTVGMLNEPVFNDLHTGLDLIVRNDADDSPVENLENSLQAEITSPDGSATRTLTLRPQYNKPGYYTDDYILTEPGLYDVRIFGFIGEMEIDETFEREVGDVSELRFP